MQEIADQLRCSSNQVQYWMVKFGIAVRARSEAMYQKYNPNGDPFFIKKPTSPQEWLLLGLGLGLWWGEGNKKNRHAVRLGNTDPQLLKKFIEFLEKICGVKRHKFHFTLQVFSDMDPEAAKKFWIRSLDIPPEQFQSKVIVTGARSIGTYREKTKHGVLTVHCNNIKLRSVFDTLMNRYAEIAQSVEHIHGGSH